MIGNLSVEEIGGKINKWVAQNWKKTLVGTGIAVGSIGMMDTLVRLDNKARSNEMKSKQRRDINKQIRMRNDDKVLREAYNYKIPYKSKPEDMVLPTYEGLNQELFMRRTNHSNTWGGRKY